MTIYFKGFSFVELMIGLCLGYVILEGGLKLVTLSTQYVSQLENSLITHREFFILDEGVRQYLHRAGNTPCGRIDSLHIFNTSLNRFMHIKSFDYENSDKISLKLTLFSDFYYVSAPNDELSDLFLQTKTDHKVIVFITDCTYSEVHFLSKLDVTLFFNQMSSSFHDHFPNGAYISELTSMTIWSHSDEEGIWANSFNKNEQWLSHIKLKTLSLAHNGLGCLLTMQLETKRTDFHQRLVSGPLLC
jgi:hypothetical protein